MLNKKSLVILAGLMIVTALMLFVSWTPATVTAQGPAPATPVPPAAVLKTIGIPGNPAVTNAMTVTIKPVTDTAVAPVPSTIANATTGLTNVPINVPVFLQVSPEDPKNTGTPTWSLIKPPDSKATITGTTTAKFTPDVVGAYMVGVTLKNAAGTSEMQAVYFDAGTFIGNDATTCAPCHASKVAEWSKTGHASIFKDNLDNSRTPTVDTHYTEACIRCHTTGYTYPGVGNGGFMDAMAKSGWKMPTWDKINAAGKKTGPSNFDTAPAEVKAMGNIQCEQCHGPASEHVKNGANVMDASFDNDVCNVCHAGGGHHTKGLEEAESLHQIGTSFEEVTGPAEQACQRCHSGAGFASFVANPKNQAAWVNQEGGIGCASCHDPHDDTNYAQLRIVGKPVEVPFANAKDAGLSGICETCHNNRSTGGDAYVKGDPGSGTPHYSSAAEMLNDTGGYTYGQTVPNSPHGMMVGAAPIPDPATPGAFLFSAADDKKGNVPGPCVTCHMQAGPSDAKDPNLYHVGGHSFNTVSPDSKTDYGAACKSCHGAVTDFNMKAKADYDGNGKVEGDQDEVKGLLNKLWSQLEAKGFKKVATGYPYATMPATMDASLKGAWYNFRYVYGVMWSADNPGGEGKAAAIHNFKRSVALLQLSIKDLNGGSLPAGMVEMK